MILLGHTVDEKLAAMRDYAQTHGVRQIFVLSPPRFAFGPDALASLDVPAEEIAYADIIEYRFFYRLLQEIDAATLVVVNECLRTQNRYDLTYNCIRHFLNQTGHQIVCQWLPMIAEPEDVMTLFDFDTRSRWKRAHLADAPLSEAEIHVRPIRPTFRAVSVATDERLRARYATEKRRLIDGIGLKDPHTIPRNLYLLSGRAKLAEVGDGWLLGRNNRFKLERLQTYREETYARAPYRVFELPHNFIDFADVVALSGQQDFDVLAADLKVDAWYVDRYGDWSRRLSDAYAALHQ